jgi:hypothetical protein
MLRLCEREWLCIPATHVFVFLFRHPQWLSRLNARSLVAPSFPFSPLLSSSSMFLAVLTSRFQKFALHRLLVHRLLVQRKTFRVHLNTIFLLASFGLRNFRISAISFASFLDGCSFVRMSISPSFLCIFVKSPTFFRRLWQQEYVTHDRNSSIGTTVAPFFPSAAGD